MLTCEAALGIILAMLAGILFVSPICLFERYILWETLDEYIDSTVIKIIACVAVNAVIFFNRMCNHSCYCEV